ncbi:hypothetical protein GYMLUDRAFT_251210 [Collybiopsis luxurians FD-317 M1]|uniref:Uncharacterized protein n=1 Tax=Collybiopsis luxurians FD-317 M1 TaxID=944289 RepID=A0A0D0BDF9_9AGAR|nr:hypothetical protein GYMLUDRAFT_251210 [Collybiopsis luxurians FD-317 M1]
MSPAMGQDPYSYASAIGAGAGADADGVSLPMRPALGGMGGGGYIVDIVDLHGIWFACLVPVLQQGKYYAHTGTITLDTDTGTEMGLVIDIGTCRPDPSEYL